MIQKVLNETPFQVLTSSFSIGPSTTGYELQISADGVNFSTLFTVGANTTRLVNNVASGSYYRLKNNVGEVAVNWRTSCKSEGGGSGSGSTVSVNQILSAGTEIAQITVDGNTTSLYAPEGGEGGDVYQLLPVSEFPETGDVQQGTLIVVEGNPDTGVVEWDGDSCYYSSFDLLRYGNVGDEESINQIIATFPDGSVLTIRRNPVDDYCSFKYWTSPDKIKDDEYEWEIGSEGDEETITTDDYEYTVSIGEEYTLTINTTEVASGDPVPFPGETRNIYVHPTYMFDSNVETWANVFPPFSYDDNAEGGSGDIAALSAIVQEQQIVFSSGYTELHTQVMELSGSTVTSYYLNKMSQAQLAALYAELNVYRNSDDTPNVDEEEAFPAGKYRFFYYNNNDDKYKGYYELQLARFDGNPAIDFSANFQSRSNSIIFQKGFRLYPDGTLEERLSNSAYLTPTITPFGFGWGEYMPLKYDVTNQQFLQGPSETVINPSGATYGIAGSDDINTILDNGGMAYFNDRKAFVTPKYEITIKENGTEHTFQNPQIIREQITTKTVDGQTFSNKYSFVYTDASGSRFIIKMALGDNNSQYGTDFEYVDLM